MITPPLNMQKVVDQLIVEEYLAPDEQTKIAAVLSAASSEIKTPWYVRGLIGISAWFAAIPLLAFLFFIDLITSETDAIVAGVVFCAIATGLRRAATQSVFVGQLTLALNLAGQLLFIGGFVGTTDSVVITVLATIALEGLLVGLYPDPLHRFLSTLIIAGAILFLFWDLSFEEAIHFFIMLIAAVTVFIWENESYLSTTRAADLYRPIGYGLPIAMFGMLCLSLTDEINISRWWISASGLLLVLLYLEYRTLSYYGLNLQSGIALWALGGTAISAIPAIQTPGIFAAIIVLMLGFQRGNRLLMGVATTFLALFLIAYYYNLEMTLLVKSFVLVGTGLMIFTIRYLLLRYLSRSVMR